MATESKADAVLRILNAALDHAKVQLEGATTQPPAQLLSNLFRNIANDAYDAGHAAGRKQGHGEGYDDGYTYAAGHRPTEVAPIE
jgi:hypothetical protein